MQYLAFFGTGECDPNKDLKQLLTLIIFLAGWFVVFRLLKKIEASDKSSAVKIMAKSFVVLLAIFGSVLLFLATWVGLACGR